MYLMKKHESSSVKGSKIETYRNIMNMIRVIAALHTFSYNSTIIQIVSILTPRNFTKQSWQ